MFCSVFGHNDILMYSTMLYHYSLYQYINSKHTQQCIVVPLSDQKLPCIEHYNIMVLTRSTTKVLISGEETVCLCHLYN